ncbi:wound-responsive family protein [Zea mays]|jgi:hypothetical protein|uniref:Wound-responsive family protein n=1 Tax=Zea mays TaxID=4577 RepID=A0A1D6N5H3_MAIZE|nr:wound-responsive family protein [Zea mays]
MEDPVAVPSSSLTDPAAAAAARVPGAVAAAPGVTSAPSALAPTQPPATAAAVSEAATPCQRQLFTVELRPGETTIVSWKKLLKEAGHTAAAPPVAVEPAFAAHAGPSGPVSSHLAVVACWLVTCCIAVICALPSLALKIEGFSAD